MSTCLISDTYVTIEGIGEAGILKVGYLDVPVRGTGYINSGPMDLPINDDGTFSLRPTWSAQTDPTTARLYILFPDGHAWGGLVPSVAGPVSLSDLKTIYGWGVVSESAIPVVTVQGPPGPGGAAAVATTSVPGGLLLDVAASGLPVAATAPIVDGIAVNAQKYGAKGDGSTADATAIGNALTAIGTGGTLILPQTASGGVYILDAALSSTLTNITVKGQGKGVTLRRAAGSTNAILSGGNRSYQGWIFENVTFDGNNRAQTGGASNTIGLGGATGARFIRCGFRDMVGAISGTGINNLNVEDCDFWGTWTGMMQSGVRNPLPLVPISQVKPGNGFTILSGSSNLRFLRSRFHFTMGLQLSDVTTGGSRQINVEGNDFRADFWCSPFVTKRLAAHTFSYTPYTTGTVTGLGTITGAPVGTGLNTYGTLGPVLAFQRDMVTDTALTSVTNAAVQFRTTLVKGAGGLEIGKGDVIETVDGKRAEIITVNAMPPLLASSAIDAGGWGPGTYQWAATWTVNGVETSAPNLSAIKTVTQPFHATMNKPVGAPTSATAWSLYRTTQRITVADAVTTASSQVITSATVNFSQNDVGQYATIPGAGLGGAVLASLIISVQSATQATLAVPANTTLSGATLAVASPTLHLVQGNIALATGSVLDNLTDATLASHASPPTFGVAQAAIAGWESCDTFEPTSPPSASTQFWITRYYATRTQPVSQTLNATDTSIALQTDPTMPLTGEMAIADAGLDLTTLPLVIMTNGNYGCVQMTGAVYNLLFHGNHLRGSHSDQLSLYNCYFPRISNNHIEAGQDLGVSVNEAVGAIITGNTIEYQGSGAVWIDLTGSYPLIGSSRSIIANNAVNHWGTAYWTQVGGILVGNGNNVVVTGNTFHRNKKTSNVVGTTGFQPNKYAIGVVTGDNIVVKNNLDGTNSIDNDGAITGTLYLNSPAATNVDHDVPNSRVSLGAASGRAQQRPLVVHSYTQSTLPDPTNRAGQVVWQSDLGTVGGLLHSNASLWTHVAGTIPLLDAGTTTFPVASNLIHATTGAPAAGLGVGLGFQASALLPSASNSTTSAVTATGSQTVTFASGPAFPTIVAGTVLACDTGGSAESVTVTATTVIGATVTSFTAVFTQTHLAGFTVTYPALAGSPRTAAQIFGAFSDPTNGSQSGYLDIYTTAAGTLTQRARFDQAGSLGLRSTNPSSVAAALYMPQKTTDTLTTAFIGGNAVPLAPLNAPVLGAASSGGAITPGSHVWAVSFLIGGVESAPSGTVSATISAPNQTQALSSVRVGPTGTTARYILRSLAGTTTPFYRVGTIADNTTTVFSDTLADDTTLPQSAALTIQSALFASNYGSGSNHAIYGQSVVASGVRGQSVSTFGVRGTSQQSSGVSAEQNLALLGNTSAPTLQVLRSSVASGFTASGALIYGNDLTDISSGGSSTGPLLRLDVNTVAKVLFDQSGNLTTGAIGGGTNGQVYTSDGTKGAWSTLATLSNPLTTQYDILYGGVPSSGVAPPTRLGVASPLDATHFPTQMPGYNGTDFLAWYINPVKHGKIHDVGGADPLYAGRLGDLSSSRIDALDPADMSTATTPVSGTVYYVCFTAPQDMTVSNLLFRTGGTGLAVSGTGAYLALGLYSVDGSDNLGELGDTGDVHASTFTTANTIYTVALTGTVAITRGTRYAASFCAVGTSITGNIGIGQAQSGMAALKPYKGRTQTGQTALPTGPVSIASAPASITKVWVALRADTLTV